MPVTAAVPAKHSRFAAVVVAALLLVATIGVSAAYFSSRISMTQGFVAVFPTSTLTRITVTPANPKVAVGQTQQFTATGTYSNGKTADLTASVTWSSSSPAVATIAASGGLAHGVSLGTSTIKATLGAVSGQTLLTVCKVPTSTLTRITVTPANPKVAVGQTQQFTATGTYSNGKTADLTASVTWSSSSPAVATIAASGGLAHGVSLGTSTIKATLGAVSGQTLLTVCKVEASTKLTYTGPTKAAPGGSVTLSATLQAGSGPALVGKTIKFVLNGVHLSATTNAAGVASVTTTAPTKSGWYPISATFAGDSTYPAASATVSLKVEASTKLTYTGPTKAAPGGSVTLSATLQAGSGPALVGKTIKFVLNGVHLSATTNAAGVASVTTTAPTKSGWYPISATFAGDSTYPAASATVSLKVEASTKLTYTGPTKAAPGGSVTLSATLQAGSGPALVGKTIKFVLNGVHLSATTNAAGVASVTTTAPTKSGWYPISATFAGDSTYPAASATVSLKVN